MTEHENAVTPAAARMSAIEFARLGDGEVAYIRQIDAEAAQDLFPALTGLPKGIDLYAVVSADGTPLSLTDSRNSAVANAIQNDLQPVSVH
ncbi:MAG: DUF1150 domain-containing protein [Hyphomicrobiales bacterium]|nr:DUF1150 domain-containing protein [Hyphomicrobiales bacterium]